MANSDGIAKKISAGNDVRRKNVANEAARLESKIKAYNATAKEQNSNKLKSANSSLDNPKSKNSSAKEKLKKGVATNVASAFGVPKEAANKAYDFAQSEQGKKIVKGLNKNAMGPVLGAAMNKMMYGSEEKKTK